jgi:hypothetical protein
MSAVDTVHSPRDGVERAMGYRRSVAIYDKVYRVLHGLDRPSAQIAPILNIQVVRSLRRLTLSDGAEIHGNDHIGELHLDNTRLALLHARGANQRAVGLEFRRALFASLRTLAQRAGPGGPLADVVAYSAITLLHGGRPQFGFERDSRRLAWARLRTMYQSALLASIHPNGHSLARYAGVRSERLWISRARLLKLYGNEASRAG